ncbi:MAG: helix-turn-helix transcriptional regulator [Clostridia bacterium]|nr:helix-turn-helix transcriptional regulator [Clostridia bacterium]
MNQEKIGNFICRMRKENNLTQEQLAEKLGVSNKSISRWENGNTMPDYSIIENLCKSLGITINELFSCEKISDEKYKEIADKNLLNALENSTFTLKEKIKYYKRKWLKEHIFNIVLGIILWIAAMLILKIKNGEEFIGYFAGMLAVLIYSVLYNKMMIYVEKKAYSNNNGEKDKISQEKINNINKRII